MVVELKKYLIQKKGFDFKEDFISFWGCFLKYQVLMDYQVIHKIFPNVYIADSERIIYFTGS